MGLSMVATDMTLDTGRNFDCSEDNKRRLPDDRDITTSTFSPKDSLNIPGENAPTQGKRILITFSPPTALTSASPRYQQH